MDRTIEAGAAMAAQETLSRVKGLSADLERAAAFAALRPLLDSGWLK